MILGDVSFSTNIDRSKEKIYKNHHKISQDIADVFPFATCFVTGFSGGSEHVLDALRQAPVRVSLRFSSRGFSAQVAQIEGDALPSAAEATLSVCILRAYFTYNTYKYTVYCT